MVVGEVATSTEVLVIGGGPGGYAAALRCAELGKDVVVVERDAIGGTCLNIGCIPSKVLIHVAELAHMPIAEAGTGVTIEAGVDVAVVRHHMRSVVDGLTSGVEKLLATAGVTVVSGTARFSRPNRVAVTAGDSIQHIEFDEAVVATGSRPIALAELPFEDDRVVDSTGALFGFDEVPDRLAVVGGGYIGVELGTAWAKLGSHVTIVEAARSILPELDPRLGRIVTRRLGELGVDVRTEATATGLGEGGLHIEAHGAASTVAADRIVVCVGRRPNTDDLGIEVMGVQLDQRGLIPVDASRRAGKGLLAIGDVTAGPALAHKATAEAEVAALTASGRAASFDVAAVPAVVFSDPEVATVGLTRAAAVADGIDARSFVYPLGASSRARTLGRGLGQFELVADAEGTVLGAHLAGPNASEIIGEMALAIEMAATVEEVAATIHPHPTMSEGLLEASIGLFRSRTRN